MKKNYCYIVVFSVLFLLISCSTVSLKHNDTFSDAQADYALHLSLNTSIDRAFSKLCAQSETIAFFPTAYSLIINNKDEIPGMNSLISGWNSNVCSFIKNHKDSFIENIVEFANEMYFEKPKELVKESDSSASKLFNEKYGKHIQTVFKKILNELDKSIIDDCISQYKSWIITQNAIHGVKIDYIKEIDIDGCIADVICEKFFSLLISYEELYRTTPDPFADSTAASVFGIN